VIGVSKKERKSWVVWEEEKAPDVIIELLSDSTANQDKTVKKEIYQNKMRVSEYFWYDPFNSEDFAGFTLNNGIYQSLPFNEQGWLVSQCLGLTLVRWPGKYRGVEAIWLRWATLEGEVLSTGQELAQKAQQQAALAQQQAELAQQQVTLAQEQVTLAQQRSDKLATKLREMGINPDEI
jgi:hypothetical protein